MSMQEKLKKHLKKKGDRPVPPESLAALEEHESTLPPEAQKVLAKRKVKLRERVA